MGRTALSQKELRRVGVLSRVKAGELKLTEAAELLRLSHRQAKRVWRRYREQGPKGLQHGNAGRRSNRAKPRKFRCRVLGLVRKYYGGEPRERLGPTLAAEQLEKDHGLRIDAETLRRWMLQEGLWSRCRKRKPYRKRRLRQEHFGELVQMDGSFAAWLEDRGPRGCLMDMVDDATGVTLAQLGEEETTWAAAGLFAGLGGAVWDSAGAVHRLEERLFAGTDAQRTTRRTGAADPVWADVRQVGD